MPRTYSDAVASLNTLQSNFATVQEVRKNPQMMNERAIPETIEWCQKIGYQPSDLSRLNAIHIAGTKGKGSTAAFISSILQQFRPSDSNDSTTTLSFDKIGLYTSPHLRFVRERIQVNGSPLTEEEFTKYFFETWDRLENAAKSAGTDPAAPGAKPVYFRFLTLMAFHTYMSMGVDTAVIECGIGGMYDTTNILQGPAVTGITSLGIDHVGMLGNTLGEIAWHKAGIMKKGVKCFTPSSQLPEAKEALERVAKEKGAELVYVDVDPDIQSGQTQLGLQADFQKINASLAVAIAEEFLRSRGNKPNAETTRLIKQGLAQVHWPGRCETRHEAGIRWCIDGGHTLESIKLAAQWFTSQVQQQIQPSSLSTASPRNSTRFLIFNQQTRDADALARALHDTLAGVLGDEKPFSHVIFCTNTTFKDTGFRPDLISVNTNASDVEALKVQNQLAETWAAIDPQAQVAVVRTIEEAVDMVRAKQRELGIELTALVTGTLHLVGGFLEVIEGGKKSG